MQILVCLVPLVSDRPAYSGLADRKIRLECIAIRLNTIEAWIPLADIKGRNGPA